MRFIVLVKATPESETGKLPGKEVFEAMGKFNEGMVKAGIMLAAEGLYPTSKAARIRFNGKQRTVIDGPFTETKELVAGFWLIQVKSKEEAIEWMKRSPFQDGEIELRPILEMSDLPADVFPPDAVAREQQMRDEIKQKGGSA